MVIWLTGISGAGKTSIAKELIKRYKSYLPHLVNVDGDEVRMLFNNDLGYDIEDRNKQINRIQSICKFLDNQKMIVIASALYSNLKILKWNRANFSDYKEIYIKASLELVQKADVKGIYSKFQKMKVKNLVGIDIEWVEPINPHLTINRDDGINLNSTIDLITKNISCFKKIK